MKGCSSTARLLAATTLALTAACAAPPVEDVSDRPVPVADLGDSDYYYAQCNGRVQNLRDVLAPIVADMSAQKIPYSQTPANEWRDCSGNFLRLSSYLASACPENGRYLAAPPGISDYRPGANNVAPDADLPGRASRDLARWYQQQGRFKPIYYDGVSTPSERPQDLVANRHLIRPGAVLWFSLDRPRSADGLEGLFTKRVSRGPHINHMGTVTEVTRDDNGEVISYAMYHGRSTGKPGSVTRAHFWTWPESYLANGSKEYPSFGYWKQYLVGVGTIVPVVSSPGSG